MPGYLINAGTRNGLMGSTGAGAPACLNGPTSNLLATSGWKTANSENWTVLAGGGDTFASPGVVNVAITAGNDEQWTIVQASSCGITQNGDCRFRFTAPTLGVAAQVDIQAWLLTQDGQNGYGVILTNNVAKTIYSSIIYRVDSGVPSVISALDDLSFSLTRGLWIQRFQDPESSDSIKIAHYNNGWIVDAGSASPVPAITSTLYPIIVLARAATSAPTVEITVPLNRLETSNDASLT